MLTVFVAAGGVLLAVKARRAPRKCRTCGRDLPESGDLCQKCRHEAAEAVRSAAAERADQRAQEEAQHRRGEQEEEQRQQKTRQEEEARLRQEEARVRQREEDARQRQEEEARQRSQLAVVSPEVFDPYAILGVPQDANQEAILAAYQAAKLKYGPDQVAHLSAEVQEHFQAKAQAVDRAYQKLTE
jgi:seryl-tRNA synthetase